MTFRQPRSTAYSHRAISILGFFLAILLGVGSTGCQPDKKEKHPVETGHNGSNSDEDRDKNGADEDKDNADGGKLTKESNEESKGNSKDSVGDGGDEDGGDEKSNNENGKKRDAKDADDPDADSDAVYTDNHLDESLLAAIDGFPKSTSTIVRETSDINSYNVWRSATKDLWVKFLYRNQLNPEPLSVVYYWCHFHGEKIFCHARGLADVPFSEFNEPGCTNAPTECDDNQGNSGGDEGGGDDDWDGGIE